MQSTSTTTVDVVALDLPRQTGERHEVVGDDDDVVGVDRVGEREAEQTAGRRSAITGGVAEAVGGGRGDDGDVDVDLAVLDRLLAAAVRAQHARGRASCPPSSRRRGGRSWSLRCGGSHRRRGGRSDWREPGRTPRETSVRSRRPSSAAASKTIFATASPLRRWWCDETTMPSAEADLLESLLDRSHPLVAVGGVVDAACNGRRRLAPGRTMPADPGVRDPLAAVDLGRHHPPRGVLDQRHRHFILNSYQIHNS